MAFTYLGLEAELTHHDITEEEVTRQLQRLAQQNPRITPVTDRPTQRGDEVVLDYAGFCGGVQFPGGTAEKQTLVLGSGAFIPGFEDQLLDKVPGEKVTVQVTFPQEYHAPELAGKEAQFHCVVHEIRIKTAYELDDTFAQEFAGLSGLEEMRQKMKESLQSYTDERGEMDLQDRLLRQAADTLDFTPTQEALDAAVEEQIKSLEAQLAQKGLNLEMYCSFTQSTPEELRQECRPDALAALKTQAAVDRVVELEKLKATQEEIGQAIAMVCRQNGITAEQLKPYYSPEFEKAIIRSIMTSKVMKLIRDAAHIIIC